MNHSKLSTLFLGLAFMVTLSFFSCGTGSSVTEKEVAAEVQTLDSLSTDLEEVNTELEKQTQEVKNSLEELDAILNEDQN